MKHRLTGKLWWGVILSLLTFISGCQFTQRQVTRAQASQLHAGMTYQQVVRALGSKGKLEAIPDSVSQWKSDADGNKITVKYRNDCVFQFSFHYGTERSKAESSELYQKYSRLEFGMPETDVEKILGTPHDTVPIKTDAKIYRWEMKSTGNTGNALVVKFKSGLLFNTRVDHSTLPTP